jgi:uncharacterized damage-inducible protein DinB
MNLPDLRTLLDYHYWARDRMLDAVAALTAEQFTRDLGSSFKSVRDTVVHLYGAEWAWYSRWNGISPTALLPAEQFADLESLRKEWVEHEANMRAFVDKLGEKRMIEIFEFRLLTGRPAALPFWQMLQHVVNHGSYHRGQITTMLRQVGASPPENMDLLRFYQERSEAAR